MKVAGKSRGPVQPSLIIFLFKSSHVMGQHSHRIKSH